MELKFNVILAKSAIFLLIFFALGIPLTSLLEFSIVLFCIPVIFFSCIRTLNKKILISIIFLIIYLVINNFIPKIKIQEGNGLILLNEKSKEYYQQNLPTEIYTFLDNKFKILFSYSKCEDKSERCWRYYEPPNFDESIYLKSDDWNLDNIEFSRITNNINVNDLTSVRIGESNSYKFNFFKYENEQDEIERDHIPYFTVYKIPKILKDSSLCWKGNTFWQDEKNRYLHIKHNSLKCKKITKNIINKKIYAISLGDKEILDLKLQKNFYLQLINLFDIFFIISFIFLLFLFNFKFNKKIYFFSFLYLLSYLLLLFYHNKALINGFEIFPGGMDGMVHITFGSKIFRDFAMLDFYNAFKGGESIFYFLPGLRYFWAFNKLIFGDTYYGYLIIPFLYTGLLYFILNFFVGRKIALFLCFINFFTNFFDGYALPNIKMISQINVGHAEPLGIFFVLLSISIMILSLNNYNNLRLSFLSFLIGFFCFLCVFVRPDYLPSCLVIFISFFYIHKNNHKLFKISIYGIFGFSFILLSPLHNYIYGGEFVLFTSNHPIIDIEGSGHNIGVPVGIYYDFILDLFRLRINDNYSLILSQFIKWIKPEQVHYIASILIILISLFFVKNKIIKIISIMSLSQHSILLIFQPDHRYAYLAWILTILIVINFIYIIISNKKIYNKSSYFKKSSTST